MSAAKTGSGFDVQLPRSLRAERRDDIAILHLARPEKRNAIDDPTVFGIEAFFAALPENIGAVVLAADGDHFCAGLDLGELAARNVGEGIFHSRSWHRAFERIEFGKAPVLAALCLRLGWARCLRFGDMSPGTGQAPERPAVG